MPVVRRDGPAWRGGTMKNISEEQVFLKQLLDMLEAHFGVELEIVLHDLSHGTDSTIVDIRNSGVTNRTIGGVQAHHGMQVVPGIKKDGNHYNEIVYTKDGKILRGSTLKIRNAEGKIIGSLCLNQDITKMVEIESYLQQRNGFHLNMQNTRDANINVLLDDMIQQALLFVGKHSCAMSKEDKINFIRYLDERGAFLISKSGLRVCKTLNISKYTLYKYLDLIRENYDPTD